MSAPAIYESGPCRPCSVCEGAGHHWLPNSIDDTDEEAVAEWREEHAQLKENDALDALAIEILMLAHFECKHCRAVREYDPEEDE